MLVVMKAERRAKTMGASTAEKKDASMGIWTAAQTAEMKDTMMVDSKEVRTVDLMAVCWVAQ